MKQKLLLKTMLLLFALIAGSSSMWAVDPASFGPSNFSGQGTSGTGGAISATVDGVTFACDKGYGTTQIRCYSGGKIRISSANTITAISFTFSGSYTGGLETSYTSLSTTSWEQTLSSQARITAVSVTYTVSGTDYTVNLAAVTNGTIETNKAKAKSGETVTLTATPGSGYVTGNWTVTDASSANVAVTKTSANKATFTMPAKDVTVSATFLVKHTVTYYVGGVENTVDRGHGTSMSLDNPVLGNLEFAGWSTTNNAASPSFVDNSTAVNADMTVYAIFVAKKEATSYNLVEASQADWRGDYLIAYSATVFANGKAKGTDGIGASSTVQNPGTKLDGKAVDGAWGDEYHITLEAIDNDDLSKGYVLKTQDGFYNYHTNNTGNGINGTSKNKATAASYPITVNYVSSSEINLTLDKGQVFRYNTTEKYFRYYKSSSYSSQGKVYLYKAAGYTYTYTLAEPFEVSISSAKYATFCDEIPRNFSASGITVFTAAADGSKVDLTEIADGIVPANTGVVLFSDEVKNNVAIPVATTDPAGDFSDNELVGINVRTVVNATESTKTNYILSNEASGVGFYKAVDGKYLGAHKAYLSTATAASAPSFLGFDGETTGINAVNGSEFKVNGEYFNLNGQRVAEPTKGLYIVNGKKVVIK